MEGSYEEDFMPDRKAITLIKSNDVILNQGHATNVPYFDLIRMLLFIQEDSVTFTLTGVTFGI